MTMFVSMHNCGMPFVLIQNEDTVLIDTNAKFSLNTYDGQENSAKNNVVGTACSATLALLGSRN